MWVSTIPRGGETAVLWLLVFLVQLSAATERLVSNHSNDDSTLIPRAAAANCSFDRDPNQIPPVPPWVFPNGILPPPNCAASCQTAMPDCCWATKCTMAFIGSCMQQGTLINRECGCPALDSEGCSRCTSSVTGRPQYYRWLNLTCGDINGWQGLPSGWTDSFSKVDLVWLGGTSCLDRRYPCWDPGLNCLAPSTYSRSYDPWYSSFCRNYSRGDGSTPATSRDHKLVFAGTLLPALNVPECLWRDCPAFWDVYNQSLVDSASFQLLNLSSTLTPTQKEQENLMFLDRAGLCGQVSSVACPGMCLTERLERTEYQLWLNNTCSGAKEFSGMAKNWTDIVAAGTWSSSMLDRWANRTDLLTFPSCAQGSCGTNLSLLANQSSDNFCILDESGQYCSDNLTMAYRPAFCDAISYPATCGTTCTLFKERRDWLGYLNGTCTAGNATWSGLPSNWTDLLSAQLFDLRPWPLVVKNRLVPDLSNCPTPEANLGVFAAVNVAMLILTPLLGRRTVVAKLTCGMLGKPHSQGWMLMGPVMVGLQAAANGINVALIKATPGYEDTSAATLMMLWFTRPRLAWLAVTLIMFQADEAMYFSCAATSLAAEIVLQLLSAFAMGTAANMARMQGFYADPRSAVSAASHGTDALLMYVGALAWLVVVFFTVVLVGVAVLDVNGVISRLGHSTVFNTLRDLDLRLSIRSTMRAAQFSVERAAASGYRTANDPWCRLHEASEAQVSALGSFSASLGSLYFLVEGPIRDYKAALHRLGGDPQSPMCLEVDRMADEIRERILKECNRLPDAEPSRATLGLSSRSNDVLSELRDINDRWRSMALLRRKVEARWTKLGDGILSSNDFVALRRRKLRAAIRNTVLGMFITWLAQWLFWIGFVRLYTPDGYCPPKLSYLALTWIFFSVFGAPLGASY